MKHMISSNSEIGSNTTPIDCFCGFYWIRDSGTPFYKWFSNDYYQMKWNQEDLFFSGFISALNSSGEVFFDGDVLQYVEFEEYKLFFSQLAHSDIFVLISTKECANSLALNLLHNLTNHFYHSQLTQNNSAEMDTGEVDKIFHSYYNKTLHQLQKVNKKKRVNLSKPFKRFEEKNSFQNPKYRTFTENLELELQLGSMSKLNRTIGHELNNVLSTILGNISLAQFETKANSDTQSNLVEAEQACEHARRLTNQLLNIAKNLGKNNQGFQRVQAEDQEKRIPIESTTDQQKIDGVIQGSGKILILDDDLSILRTSKKMLSRLGYDVYVADSLQKALALYQKHLAKGKKFDVAILDLSELGGIGGFGALIWQKIDPGINAIVSSGYANDPVFEQYQRHGFRGVLKKPYDLRKLSEVIYQSLH